MGAYTRNILLVISICMVLFSCREKEKTIPSLVESFSRTDQKPFGGYIAYRQLQAMFTENVVFNKKQSIKKTWNEISDTASLYVCLTPKFYVNDDEIDACKNFVKAGNTLFISANYIDEDFLKMFECSEKYFPTEFSFYLDSMRDTKTKFYESDYSYYYNPFKNALKFKDSASIKVLGYNDENEPNFIVIFHGKGRLFLQCDPKAFSNYFLLKKDNYQYFQNAFSFVDRNPQYIYWDDYYLHHRSKSNNKDFSSLDEILKYPALAAAFWLSLCIMVLYILFDGKRRQRIIEKIKPNENSSVTFTETIGRLYLQKKDNKNIAEKMVTYFNEHIRNNYFLNTNNINDDFITMLSRKSGVNKAKVESLYRAMQHVQTADMIDDYQLLSLNNQMQDFYKKG